MVLSDLTTCQALLNFAGMVVYRTLMTYLLFPSSHVHDEAGSWEIFIL